MLLFVKRTTAGVKHCFKNDYAYSNTSKLIFVVEYFFSSMSFWLLQKGFFVLMFCFKQHQPKAKIHIQALEPSPSNEYLRGAQIVFFIKVF